MKHKIEASSIDLSSCSSSPYAAISSALLCVPFHSSNQSLHKNVGNDNYLRFRLDDRGRKSLEGKTEDREGENLEALTHFSHRQNL
jgi:hypothetical protein